MATRLANIAGPRQERSAAGAVRGAGYEHGRWSNARAAAQLLWQESDGPIRTGLAVVAILVLACSALATLAPVLLKMVVDFLSAAGPSDASPADIALLGAGYALVQWLVKILSELRMVVVGRTDQRLHRRLSSRLLARVMAFPVSRYVGLKPGVVSQTLANGLSGYRLVVQHVSSSVLPVILELCLISMVIAALGEPLFLLIICLALLGYVLVLSVGAVSLSATARTVSASQIESSSLLTEIVQGLETIKYFCSEDLFRLRFVRGLCLAQRLWRRFYLQKGLQGALLASVFGMTLVISTYLAGRKVQAGQMTVGDFILVNAYMIQAFRPMEMLSHALRDVAQGLAFIERMVDLVREDSEGNGLGLPLTSSRGALTFERVTFSYGGSTSVLRQVSFRLESGATVAVVGPSGSGKTSLIRLIVKFFEPDSGRILLDGVPISEIETASLRSVISVVPQDITLFEDSVANNIAIGNPRSSADDIRHSAIVAGVHDVVSSWPCGYQTVIGERGRRLSGGERQRIAIARAVLRRPRLLVLDEGTSALDSAMERRILANIAQEAWRPSMLVVAHRLATVMNADRILVLANGAVVASGCHDELLYSSDIYKEMWIAQQPRTLTRRGSRSP